MAEFSRTLYRILDHIGYNEDIVKFRRETWRYFAELFDIYASEGKTHCITAGSKGEGISSVLESDIDKIHLCKDIMCISSEDQLPRLPQHHIIVFLADMVNAPPGYTRLKLHRPTSARQIRDNDIRECLFESESGDAYLSSSFWTSAFRRAVSNDHINDAIFHDITGPALPISYDNVPEDTVLGLSIPCPHLLQSWASRPRNYEWPSRDTIHTACSFLPQVVAVGAKGSDRQYQEWRFCFIESELTLTHSLNGTQNKLYILLKMIGKSVLKQVTGEISSYIMKNVTYWLSELLPMCVFIGEHLVSLVLLALGFLRMAIAQWDTLPYYMIPSRNLLSERLDDHTKRELSDVLSSLLQEGSQLFLRIEKLRICLECAPITPNVIVKYGKMRDQVEKNTLACIVFTVLKEFNVHLDESIKENLIFSIRNVLVQHLNASYPLRFGLFNAEEIERAYRMVLS